MNTQNPACKPLIYDLDLTELRSHIQAMGEASYRADQIWENIYKHLLIDPDQFTVLSLKFREKLAQNFSFSGAIQQSIQISSDKETSKVLLQLADQQAIETVLMRYNQRRTLCISTQAGCRMGCTFCATGQMGFIRNLSSGEIIAQVLFFARQLKEIGEQVTNIVMMGMGEPFDNYESTLKAIECLNHPKGMELGKRRFTISTVGLIPLIQRFSQEKNQVNLAISLHAANDELRSSLLPINRKYPLKELLAACHQYVLHTGRRITFEWALIQNINDSIEDAQQLTALIKGLNCHVNIILLNPTREYTGSASTSQRASAFCKILENNGIPCTIRLRRGIDIQAGCGQLASSSENG